MAKKYPVLWSLLSLFIVSVPAWIGSVWALFKSEPFFVVLGRKLAEMNFHPASLNWVTLPVGLLMFSIVLFQLRRQRAFSFEYSWGLCLSALSLGVDTAKIPKSVQIGLIFYNTSDGPIKYEVENLEVIIDGRTIAHPKFDSKTGIIERGTTRTYFYPAFDGLLPENKTHLEGVVRYVVKYGHPEVGFVRRAQKDLKATPPFLSS